MHLSLHSEVATLPISYQDKGVKECFFKINYWGMAKEVVDKIRVLAEFGFGSGEAIEVDGKMVVPRDLMITMLSQYTPPITDFLAAPTRQPPNWVKEIVTEVRGAKDGKPTTYTRWRADLQRRLAHRRCAGGDRYLVGRKAYCARGLPTRAGLGSAAVL